jgi:phage antirepressor YoqD-like protein
MSALLTEDALKKWSGYSQRAKLEAWLKQNKISYTYAKGNKLITTQEAIDRSLLGTKAANQEIKQDAFF